jgi:hypothetical protein
MGAIKQWQRLLLTPDSLNQSLESALVCGESEADLESRLNKDYRAWTRLGEPAQIDGWWIACAVRRRSDQAGVPA